MDRNGNNKGHQVTESLDATVALDSSLAASLTVSIDETKREEFANNTATNTGGKVANSAADKNQNRLKAPTVHHSQKSPQEMERIKFPNSENKDTMEGDDNDSSVSSISSGEGEPDHKRNSGDSDHPILANDDGHQNITYDENALASKREYNRQNAARARKRAKTQLQNLQQQVQALNMSITQLKERNIALHQTVQTLKEQNALLAQNQGSIEGNPATTANNVASSIHPRNTTTTDSSLQTTLLQLLLATATAPSPDLSNQQSQASLSIQQQTLYYWLLSQVLQQYQQSQNNNMVQQPQLQPPAPVQPIQMHSTTTMNASDQLMALLLSQVQSGTASGHPQPDSNDAKSTQSLPYPSSRDTQTPPK